MTNREPTAAANRIPALNIEVVQKQTERQRLIQQMLQPGDQYGFEQSQSHAKMVDVRSSVVINPSNKTMGVHPHRHNKIYSDAQNNRPGQQQSLPENCIYGFTKGTEISPVERKKKSTNSGLVSQKNQDKIQNLHSKHNNSKTRSSAIESGLGMGAA